MSEMSPNSLKNLAPRFSKENQPANRGRKPSQLSAFIKDNNLSHADVKNMAKSILPMNEEKIKKLILDKKKPIVMRLFATSLLKDLQKGKMNNILHLLDRAFGKPTETIDLNEKKEDQIHVYLPENNRDLEPETVNDE